MRGPCRPYMLGAQSGQAEEMAELRRRIARSSAMGAVGRCEISCAACVKDQKQADVADKPPAKKEEEDLDATA